VGLREIAEADLAFILEDGAFGFGFAIKVTNPAGDEQNLTGYTADISQLIDDETGTAVSGRLATVAIRISTLTDLKLPVNIAKDSSKPWLITFNDINGIEYTFKVQDSDPDRALGIVVLTLEFWKA
jgi:hypothetical protein